jgi:Domain of unknown function (DUF1996)
VWGRADGDPYDPYGSGDPEPVPPVKLRSRVGASLVIVALLGATARGGWLIFAGPTPISAPTRVQPRGPLDPSTDTSTNTPTAQSLPSGVMPSVAFAVRCRLSHEASDDPILLPGKPGASHQHSFFGNRTTNASSTAASLVGGQTSCDDLGDTAAYWLPTPVGAKWTAIRAYYGAGQLQPSDLASYPDGLALIGGNPPHHDHHPASALQRAQPTDKPSEAQRVQTQRDQSQPDHTQAAMWSCGRAIDEPGWTVTMPQCANGKQLAARITFGQCMQAPENGQPNRSQPSALTKAVSAVQGKCPPNYPLGIPELRIRAELSGTPSAWSSGALGTLHADFLNAWDPKTLENLVDVCIRGQRTAGQIKLCGLPGTGPRITGFGS